MSETILAVIITGTALIVTQIITQFVLLFLDTKRAERENIKRERDRQFILAENIRQDNLEIVINVYSPLHSQGLKLQGIIDHLGFDLWNPDSDVPFEDLEPEVLNEIFVDLLEIEKELENIQVLTATNLWRFGPGPATKILIRLPKLIRRIQILVSGVNRDQSFIKETFYNILDIGTKFGELGISLKGIIAKLPKPKDVIEE